MALTLPLLSQLKAQQLCTQASECTPNSQYTMITPAFAKLKRLAVNASMNTGMAH